MSSRFLGWSVGIVALCTATAAMSSGSVDPADPVSRATAAAFQRPVAGRAAAPSDDDRSFDDAPYGVDPIVTGPVSAAFKRRQETLHCAERVWPDIPAACYPD
jgi:hypothetical protein